MGPMCNLLQRPYQLADGTICRCESPLPGIAGKEVSYLDHFGADSLSSTNMAQEGWFEERYPNLLEDARLTFVETVNAWVEAHWGQSEFNEKTPRIAVHGRNKYESKKNANVVWTNTKMRDDRFESCGDTPQSWNEADKLVGSFAIDFETPVKINYGKVMVLGAPEEIYQWTAVLYVEDTLGAQSNDSFPDFVKRLAPSRTVKRGRWKISGTGSKPKQFAFRKHVVVAGDTLSDLANRYYKDTKLWPVIYRINWLTIGANPHKLSVGTVLQIPELSELGVGYVESAVRFASTAANNPNPVLVPPPW